jgi:hypothetical protein
MDFTINQYKTLIESLNTAGLFFLTFDSFIGEGKRPVESSRQNTVTLRHDVDLMPGNSLRFARIQDVKGIKGSYYFRAVPESWDDAVIREISAMGHEVGYHYESLTTCHGNHEAAWDDFRRNLDRLRALVPVSTIVMHGSPRSKWDSRDLWKHYDYRSLGIIGEPYFDIDFSKVFYITDTGRCWDGDRYSVRDKPLGGVQSSKFKVQSSNEIVAGEGKQWPRYHSTKDIIRAVEEGTFPKTTMMTFHPQRWHDNLFDWSKELVMQNAKNVIKKWFFVQ